MQILSYNLNGIRSAINKGWLEWLATHQFDVICVQETKAQPDQIDTAALAAMGYHSYCHSAEKKGYSGVAIFTKKEPLRVVEGMGVPMYDKEGRVIRADFVGWSLLNCYCPSGTSGEERQAVKMQFLKDFYDWITILRQEQPNLIVVGDYNIAHQEIDIHDPKGNKNSTGFLPEERAWMTQWFGSGFADAFRYLHPAQVLYSWWSFRANARANNKGWRIDYQSVSMPLKDKIRGATMLNEAQHSDHCPVLIDIDL